MDSAGGVRRRGAAPHYTAPGCDVLCLCAAKFRKIHLLPLAPRQTPALQQPIQHQSTTLIPLFPRKMICRSVHSGVARETQARPLGSAKCISRRPGRLSVRANAAGESTKPNLSQLAAAAAGPVTDEVRAGLSLSCQQPVLEGSCQQHSREDVAHMMVPGAHRLLNLSLRRVHFRPAHSTPPHPTGCP